MLRSRAAHLVPSLPLRRGINAQWRCKTTKSTSSAKQPLQVSPNRTNEEDLISRTLGQTSDSAFIRAWAFPESMRDALAIVRAVERKYGLIREFRYYRDFEVSSRYQLIIRVAFRDPNSQKRIPENAEELEVILPPPLPSNQPGGIGLADLEEYLSSTESPLSPPQKSGVMPVPNLGNVMTDVIENAQANEDSENAERVITCQIQRARSPIYAPSRIASFWPHRSEREAIARQFLNWGGFHDFPPIEKDTPLLDKDFFESPKLEHFRMRRCLRRASKYLKAPNPYEYSAAEHSPSSVGTELEWEPLSDSSAEQTGHDILSATLTEQEVTIGKKTHPGAENEGSGSAS